VRVDVQKTEAGESVPALVHARSGSHPVVKVLATWRERGAISEEPLTCHRVLLESGEITLVHERRRGAWMLRGASLRPPPLL
jgi:hypothetical protein